jgi:hypothetical protein
MLLFVGFEPCYQLFFIRTGSFLHPMECESTWPCPTCRSNVTATAATKLAWPAKTAAITALTPARSAYMTIWRYSINNKTLSLYYSMLSDFLCRITIVTHIFRASQQLKNFGLFKKFQHFFSVCNCYTYLNRRSQIGCSSKTNFKKANLILLFKLTV